MTGTNIDNYIPTEKWEFNEEVTSKFSNMISRSIPDYDTMRDLVNRLSIKILNKGYKNNLFPGVNDIGCSNGLSIMPLADIYKDHVYNMFDNSLPMIEDCKKNLSSLENTNYFTENLQDIPEYPKNTLTLSILTIQFTPIEYRQNILKKIYDSIESGGALIIVEKVIGETVELDDLMIDTYYDYKRINGYSEELIKAKRKSLEGALVPLTYDFNNQLLKNTGFKKVDTFWRCLNFVGWICVK